MKKLYKPTAEDRKNFLMQIMTERQVNKREAFELLSLSCGNSISGVEKLFATPGTSNYRDCPPAVWRCWMIDFNGGE